MRMTAFISNLSERAVRRACPLLQHLRFSKELGGQSGNLTYPRMKPATVRILFWTEQFWPAIGGAEIFATKLLPALQTRGYEPVVVTDQTSPDLPTEAQYKGIPVYRLPFRTVLTD